MTDEAWLLLTMVFVLASLAGIAYFGRQKRKRRRIRHGRSRRSRSGAGSSGAGSSAVHWQEKMEALQKQQAELVQRVEQLETRLKEKPVHTQRPSPRVHTGPRQHRKSS